MRAAAINPVLVPGQRVHEGLDEQPEGVRLVELKLLEQVAEQCRIRNRIS